MTRTSSVVAIVPAAGSGMRMKATLPKQYLRIGGKTVLEYTLSTLLHCSHIDRIIVVLSDSDRYFSTLPVAHHPKITSVIGGKTRAESVLAGLQNVKDSEWALVHDAARPCVTEEDIEKLIDIVLRTNQGGILAVPIVDTVKQAEKTAQHRIEKTLDRTFLWYAVTPQLFLAKELKTSLEKAIKKRLNITDEAAAIEYNGGKPLLVSGRRDNIKITQPEDLSLVTFYLQDRDVGKMKNKKENKCE